MKLLNKNQIKNWDIETVKKYPISSHDLMERAGKKCYDKLIHMFPEKKIHIVVNKGNNGGDGLVIFRHLLKDNKNVRLTIIDIIKNKSEDFNKNLNLISKQYCHRITNAEELLLKNDELIIDCIFGYGINRETSDTFAEIIRKINNSQVQVVSIDMPSGLFPENNSNNNGAIIKANYTYTFEIPKISLLLPSYQCYYGEVHIISIGLDKKYLQTIKSNYHYITKQSLPKLNSRHKFAHKGNFGHGLLIGGSNKMKGAIILSSIAAMKSGIGKVSVNLPDEYIRDLNIQLPEAIIDNILNLSNLKIYDAIGIGPGLNDKSKYTHQLVKSILHQRGETPIVIDAGAINIIAKNNNLLSKCENTIFTPHPKEFKRLVGDYKSDEEKLEKQINFSRKNNLIVILKGAHTTISINENLYFNSSGNTGLSKAGSGDVLTGLITSLLSQGYNVKDASILGVFIHGYAAELCLDNETEETMIPSNIINKFVEIFNLIK